jgi:hypothetical protein
MEGQESVMSVLGPMSNSLSGLKIFSKVNSDLFHSIMVHLGHMTRQLSIPGRGYEILCAYEKHGTKRRMSLLNTVETEPRNVLRCYMTMDS